MKHLLHLLFTSTLVSTLSLTALGAVQRDLSFLPSTKEAGALDRSNGYVYDAEVEYLESNGAQYIDSGIFATQNTVAEYGAETFNDGATGGFVFGTDKGWIDRAYSSLIHISANNRVGSFVFGKSNFHFIMNSQEKRLDVLMDSSGATVNTGVRTVNVLFSSQVDFTSFSHIYIFSNCRNGTPSEPSSHLRIYYLKFYDSTTLVRDFIPVVKDGIGYMYDRVSGRLFGNSGTGAFTVGPITHVVNRKVAMGKKWVNPYITDGLVAMWDGEWNSGPGVHDPNATVWKDLIANKYSSILTPQWGANCFNVGTSNVIIVPSGVIGNLTIATVEIAFTNLSTAYNVSPAIGFDSGKDFGVLGGHRYSTVPYQGNTRIGYICSNRREGFVGIDVCSYEEPISCQMSFLYDTLVKVNNKAYMNGDYKTYYNYSNETGLTGNLYARVNGSFPTSIYCMRFYNRALTAAEIQHNYQVDKARFNLP